MTTKIHNKITKGNKSTIKRDKTATQRHTMTFQRDKT